VFGKEYRLTTKSFEWGYPVLPQKGDLLNLEDFENIGIQEPFSKKSYDVIMGNLFPLSHLYFTQEEGKKIIEMCIGDWGDDDEYEEFDHFTID
jgi:hypothetical protein